LDVEVKDIDSEHEDERRRFLKGIDLIKGALDGLDMELSPEQLLINLNNHLRQAQIWNALESYASGPSVQHLRTANDHLTGQLPLVHQIAALARPPEAAKVIKSIEKAYRDFCKVIEKKEKNFHERLTKGEASLEKIEKGLAANKEALENLNSETNTAFSKWQQEFADAQNSRAKELSDAQIKRNEEFHKVMRDIRAKSEAETTDISAKHVDRLEAAFEAHTKEVQERLDDIKAKHAAILEIHGLVGTDGVAGGYQKGASDEHKAANIWRRVAMVSLSLAAAWLLLKFYLGFGTTPSGGINWAELITTASLTFVLLVTAGYAARQSKTHRNAEQQMRWFALEVKAIDPFLSSLEDADQKELKKQLSERLFGKDRTADHMKLNGADVDAFRRFFDLILSRVSEIAKATGKQ